jgi:hypothetical protein
LLIVVFPSGKKSFIVRYRFAGIKRKLTLGDIGLAAARKAAADALYQVHQGNDPSLAKRETKARASITNTETGNGSASNTSSVKATSCAASMCASAPLNNWFILKSATCR